MDCSVRVEDRGRRAFTLIELLAVMAIIAALAALLLPALSRAKHKAATAQCLNNLRQLQICWHCYAVDNQDEHPDTLYDPCFSNPVDMPTFIVGPQWWDMPSDRHNQGAALSFADGHVERWRWRAPMTFAGLFRTAPAEQLPDYFRVLRAMKKRDSP